MADYVFKKSDAGIRNLLKSDECLQVMIQEAEKIAGGDEMKPFIGFDRAKVFIERRDNRK